MTCRVLQRIVHAHRGSLLALLWGLPLVSLSAEDRDPVLLGRWPTFGGVGLSSVAVEGDLAYCGTEMGVLILDVGSTPEDPLNVEPVGSWSGPAVRSLALSGDRVYATSAGASLVVLDVSDPTEPREVGRDDGEFAARALAVMGDHVLLLGPNLKVFDVSGSGGPRLVGALDPSGCNPWDIFVSGSFAYVACQAASPGLMIIDVSDPTRPRQIGSLDGIGSTVDVVVDGNHAYLYSQHVGGVIADVSDPANPRTVEIFSGASGLLAVAGEQLFTGTRIYDVSDPTNARELRVVEPHAELADLSDLAVQGDHMYLAGRAGLEIFEIRRFDPPAELIAVRKQTQASQVFRVGSHVYVDGVAPQESWPGLEVLDISDPTNPTFVGRLAEYPGEINGFFAATEDIFVAGDYAYVAGGPGGLRVVNVTNPAAPVQVAMLDTGGRARSVWVSGDHAFVTSGRRFLVIDISNPLLPAVVAEEAIFRDRDLFVQDGFAYVVNEGHLQILDVRNPRGPISVGTFDDFSGRHVFISGDFAYVAGSDAGLRIVDVSDPTRPQLASQIFRESTGHVVVEGGLAYLSSGGVEVIDVSDPFDPRPLHRYLYSLGRFALHDGLLLGASGRLGFRVIDTSVPPTPALRSAASVETSLDIEDVAVAGSHALVVGSTGGLHVLDVSETARPRRVAHEPGTPGSGVFLSGGVACIVDHSMDGRTRLVAVDVSDPRAPRTGDAHEVDFPVKSMVVDSGYAYLLHEEFGVQPRAVHVRVVDIRDFADLRQVGSYSTTGESHGLFASGTFAYLAVERDLEIIDLSDPEAPKLVVRQERPFELPVVLSGDRAHAAYWDQEFSGLESFDIADPVNPVSLGNYAGKTGEPLAVAQEGKLVFSKSHPHHFEEGLHLIDVIEPARPQLVGRLPETDLKAASGNHAFTVERQEPRELRILDVGKPANPQTVGRLDGLSRTAERGGLAASGDHVYVANGDEGLLIVDVSDPAAPRSRAEHDTEGTVEGVFLSGQIACLADGFGGLEMVDVGDPENPRRLGGIEVIGQQGDGYAYDVFVVDGRAHVASWTSGRSGSVEIIDIRAPDAPRRLGRVATAHVADRIVVAGDYAFASARQVEVIDVSNPARPRRVAALPGGSGDVFVSGQSAYVAAGEALEVFDVQDPASPRLLGRYPLGFAARVHVSGEYAYVLDRLLGLEIIDVHDPARPRRVGGNSAALRWRSETSLALTRDGDRLFVASGGDGFAVLELSTPFPPTEVTAIPGDGEVALTWSPPESGIAVLGYDVDRIRPGPRQQVNTETISGTEFTVGGLENGAEYCFVVRSRSAAGDTSVDSGRACVELGSDSGAFIRGDCNDDGSVDLSDALCILRWLFLEDGAIECVMAANVDGSEAVDITDPIVLLQHLFLGGREPAPPYPGCGISTLEVDVSLGCEASPERCGD